MFASPAGRSEPSESVEDLLGELVRVHPQARIRRFDEVLAQLDRALELADPQDGARLALETRRAFQAHRRSSDAIEARIRAALARMSTQQILDFATPEVMIAITSELLRRREGARAAALLRRFRADAEAEDLWFLSCDITIHLANTVKQCDGVDAAFHEIDAAIDAIPDAAASVRHRLTAHAATIAIASRRYEQAVARIDHYEEACGYRVSSLARILIEAHQHGGREALQRGDVAMATSHYLAVIERSGVDDALIAALTLGAALMRVGDYTTLMPAYESLVARPDVSPHARKRLCARIGLGYATQHQPVRALETLREAFASSTILDRLEPEPLDAYATLLEANGEPMLATWARNRADAERNDAVSARPRGLERD